MAQGSKGGQGVQEIERLAGLQLIAARSEAVQFPEELPEALALLQLLAAQRLLPSQEMRDQRNLGKVFNRFHLHVRMMQVGTIRDHPVVRHENSVELGNQRFECSGKLRRSRL